jgi:hypothetical protein
MESKALALHPILLPAILFDTLLESSLQHGADLRKDIVEIEKKLAAHVSDRDYSVKGGTEDGVMDEDKLTQSFEYLQDMGARLNTSMKKQASRDGRHKFWRKFGEALSHALKAVDDIASSELKRAVGEEFHEWLFVDDGIFDSLEDRDVNYRKRMETQETKVCLGLPV